MGNRLSVNRRWCATCKMCRYYSAGVIQFDQLGYPLDTAYPDCVTNMLQKGVSKCPVHALTLRTA